MPKPLPLPDGLIDEPGPFDTLGEWLAHLRILDGLPDGSFLKAEMIENANEMIARKRAAMN